MSVKLETVVEDDKTIAFKTKQHIHPQKRQVSSFKAAERQRSEEGINKMQHKGAGSPEGRSEASRRQIKEQIS